VRSDLLIRDARRAAGLTSQTLAIQRMRQRG
jgi:hypothetical protein